MNVKIARKDISQPQNDLNFKCSKKRQDNYLLTIVDRRNQRHEMRNVKSYGKDNVIYVRRCNTNILGI